MSTTISQSVIDKVKEMLESNGFTVVDHHFIPGEVRTYFDEVADAEYEETENDMLEIAVKENINWNNHYNIISKTENLLNELTGEYLYLELVTV